MGYTPKCKPPVPHEDRNGFVVHSTAKGVHHVHVQHIVKQKDAIKTTERDIKTEILNCIAIEILNKSLVDIRKYVKPDTFEIVYNANLYVSGRRINISDYTRICLPSTAKFLMRTS